MLGLTIPDAIAFGSLCAALLAAYAGLSGADRARTKRSDPSEALAEGVERLTLAIVDLADAIRSAAPQIDDHSMAVIQVLMRRLDDRAQDKWR